MEHSDDTQKAEKFETVSFSLKIKAELDLRISNHIRALKHLEGRGYSKKRWVQEAIKEKLQAWKQADLEKLLNDATLNFSISGYTNDEIVKIINSLRKLKIRTSKTDFFLEAIREKLDREEMTTKNLFQTMLKNICRDQQSSNVKESSKEVLNQEIGI